DLGLAGHLVVASIEEPLAIEYVDPGGGACKTQEYYGCDAQGAIKSSGMGVAASAGVLARPTPSIELGAQVKTPWSVRADGTTTVKIGGNALPSSPTTISLSFPLNARIGGRYIGLQNVTKQGRGDSPPEQKVFEAYDVELDATYDPWSSTNPGPV